MQIPHVPDSISQRRLQGKYSANRKLILKIKYHLIRLGLPVKNQGNHIHLLHI